MEELHLLIDDLRSVGQDIVARTPDEGKRLLATKPVTHLYIDHDLGLDPQGNEYDNGYKVVCWAIENNCLPCHVQIVSSNPVGRQNIEAALTEAGYIRERGYWVMYWLKDGKND